MVSEKPQWVPDDWLMFSRGYDLGDEVPDGVRGAFDDPDPWVRVVAITLAAMQGDFYRVDDLVEIASTSEDEHLQDCAIRVFSQAASPASIGRLAVFLDHPNSSVRITAYQGVMMSCHLPLVRTLASVRAGKDVSEQTLIEVRISALLEPLDEGEFIVDEDEIITDSAYEEKVSRRVRELQMSMTDGQAIHFGAPLDIFSISGAMRTLLAEEDPENWGGALSDLMDTLEGLIGVSVLGCFNDDVEPIIPPLQAVLSQLRRDPRLLRFQNGNRTFFGHTIP